jgi:hypothetical protein
MAMVDQMMAAPPNVVLRVEVPPDYWDALSTEDKLDFFKLWSSFAHENKAQSRADSPEGGQHALLSDLVAVLRFVNRSSDNVQLRSLTAGIAWNGSVMCVNTRTLKALLCRCKSSVNNIFQRLGYITVKNAQQIRQGLLATLPLLSERPERIRQWTVREAAGTNFAFPMPPEAAEPLAPLVLEFTPLFSEPPAEAAEPAGCKGQ